VRTAQNALKHGERSAPAIAFRRQLRQILNATAEATANIGEADEH